MNYAVVHFVVGTQEQVFVRAALPAWLTLRRPFDLQGIQGGLR
jgi:hypothetical protein